MNVVLFEVVHAAEATCHGHWTCNPAACATPWTFASMCGLAKKMPNFPGSFLQSAHSPKPASAVLKTHGNPHSTQHPHTVWTFRTWIWNSACQSFQPKVQPSLEATMSTPRRNVATQGELSARLKLARQTESRGTELVDCRKLLSAQQNASALEFV